MMSEGGLEKFHTDEPDLGSASDWLKQIPPRLDQSEALPTT